MAYPVVQERSVYFKPQVQLLLLFTMNLFDGPFLELIGRDCVGCAGRECREKVGQDTGRRCMVIGRGDLEVDADEFQVRLAQYPDQYRCPRDCIWATNLPL